MTMRRRKPANLIDKKCLICGRHDADELFPVLIREDGARATAGVALCARCRRRLVVQVLRVMLRHRLRTDDIVFVGGGGS